jgi:hypothetical protein
MGQITLTIDIENSDGTAAQVKKVITPIADIKLGREAILVDELAHHLGAELRLGDNRAALPSPSNLAQPSKQARTPMDPMDMINPWNADGIWLEICNSCLHVAHNLALAKAYWDTEPKEVPIERWYYCHAQKTAALHLAVFYLAKVQDLVVRLLFESIGERLIQVDQSDPDWERQLTMRNLKNGLARLHSSGDLKHEEYVLIVAAIDKPTKAPRGKLVVEYRNRVAHRLAPSVDHTELSPVLQDRVGRPVYDEHGSRTGTAWPFRIASAKPDFVFEELYDAIVEYLSAVVSMLEQLKALPRFA